MIFDDRSDEEETSNQSSLPNRPDSIRENSRPLQDKDPLPSHSPALRNCTSLDPSSGDYPPLNFRLTTNSGSSSQSEVSVEHPSSPRTPSVSPGSTSTSSDSSFSSSQSSSSSSSLSSSRSLHPTLPPGAYTPHGNVSYSTIITSTERAKNLLEEVKARKSRLIYDPGGDFRPETSGIVNVKVIRSWRLNKPPNRGAKSISVPSFISGSLYEAIDNNLPSVADEKVLRRALVYLKLVAKPDPRSGYLPFHEQAVARIRQAPSLAKRHEAKVYRLAERLQDALSRDLGTDTPESPFNIIGHKKGHNCVQVGGLNLPASVEEAFRKEKASVFISEQKYNLQHWTKDRPEHRRRRLDEKRQKAKRTTRRHDNLPVRVERLQKRLNALPKQRFTRLFDRAKPRLEELALERQEESHADGDGYIPYRNQLMAISDNPIPLYKFTDRTLRLAPAGPSLASLPTEMRRAVFDDYLEVDMSSAQLALAASLWGDLKDLRDFLSSPSGEAGDCNPQSQGLRQARRGNADWKEMERDWWHALTEWLNRELPSPKYDPKEDFERVKGVLKGFTYGLFYGMKKSNLVTLGTPHAATTDRKKYFESVKMMTELFLGPRSHPRKVVREIGMALLDHPLVEQLVQKRDEMLSRIEKSGGITDCFGRFIETGDDRAAKSVLAEHMQNAELRVMLPLAETILDDDEMRFGLWQHDGVTVAPRRRKAWAYKRVYEKTAEALREGCRNLANKMDIPPIETTLTIDHGKEYLSR